MKVEIWSKSISNHDTIGLVESYSDKTYGLLRDRCHKVTKGGAGRGNEKEITCSWPQSSSTSFESKVAHTEGFAELNREAWVTSAALN